MSDLLRRRAMMMAQSQKKTMQLLAEYTVTEPTNSFTIPITERMRSCGLLYVNMEITETDLTWLYISLTAAQGNYYNTKGTSFTDRFHLVLLPAVTIDGVTFGPRTFTSAALFTPLLYNGAPSGITFHVYEQTSFIKSGSVKIYGEV